MTVASPDGPLNVDHAISGRPLGVEVTAALAVPLDRLNQLLAEPGTPPLAEEDDRPARAAQARIASRTAAAPETANRAISGLSPFGVPRAKFGKKGEVDPVAHLIGTAIGWGGNPDTAIRRRLSTGAPQARRWTCQAT